MDKKKLTHKKWIRHILIWLSLYVFFFLGEIRMSPKFALWDSFMVVVSLILIYYTNNYWRKKEKKDNKTYRYKTFTLVFIVSFINIFIEILTGAKLHYGIEQSNNDWYTIFSVTIFLIFNFSSFFVSEIIALQQENVKQKASISKLKEERLASQLELLKSKMNPHFLFNSLNAIYSMSYLKDERTTEKIMQLSEMFRYLTYECNSFEVSLDKEVESLKNYIELNQIRCKYNQEIYFNIEGDIKKTHIAPMLLLPFVENAFKHSHIFRERNSFIKINLKTDTANKLVFSVINTVPERKRENLTINYGGIGIDNVKKRLELQYPQKYKLELNEEPGIYKIVLELKLS